MKGIILAGGSGTRLYPLTKITSKQLLPVYDKPMIYYPLSILMLAEIRDILIISTPNDLPNFKRLLGDGSDFGINLSYKIQEKPEGIAQAFLIGENFLNGDSCTLILGDNIYYGNKLGSILKGAIEDTKKGISTIFGYRVDDPERFGVVEFNNQNEVISIEEKPKTPKSNYAITGLYVYDNNVSKNAKLVKKSARGELEITDLNKIYLKENKLNVKLLGRGFSWFDTGTISSLLDASNFIKIVEEHQKIKISALEEIAYLKGWISLDKINEVSQKYGNSSYGKYLKNVAEGKIRY